MAILSPLFYWPEYGSMFTGPAAGASADTKADDAASEATTATPGENTTAAATVRICPVQLSALRVWSMRRMVTAISDGDAPSLRSCRGVRPTKL